MAATIDIILPCYNPSDKWHFELLKFYELAKTKYHLQFIVVDDGSKTGNLTSSVETLKQKNIPVQFVSYKTNKGKGHALRTGVQQSSADYIMYTDIDLPFTQQSMEAVLNELLTDSYDVVAGYREENYYENKMSGFRKLLSKSFRGFLKNILRLPLSDTQAGLKAFNKKGRTIFLSTQINRYLFDFEFIYTCSKHTSVRVGTISVQLKENVVFSKMPFRTLVREVFNLFRVLTAPKGRNKKE